MFNVYINFHTLFLNLVNFSKEIFENLIVPVSVLHGKAENSYTTGKPMRDGILLSTFVDINQLNTTVNLAPFKLKFSRMSKSNSLNRSSTETEQDSEVATVRDPLTSTMTEEGNESVSTESYNADISSMNSNSNSTVNSNSNKGRGGNAKILPSSPPPSYDFVLKESRRKQQRSVNSQSSTAPPRAQEIMHKSSKEFYKAVAKQFGITCKMSDHCRCYDCQSHYFDCEYEQNEQEKTDGGLGAGTPVFLHEVMHGTACNIL
ncbi:hypothetical protein ABEB36_002238 [Hypothenemus hampei]|uniref:DUF4802 domain-containing protein n=1 Tax=Hypothenemus hampei TaxID=57062 RepID=A0ABD1F511_HYPHA